MATKAEKRYMDRVASLPCSLCGTQPVELHHLREGQGMSQRASNYLVIPLCPRCHRDNYFGWHGEKVMWKVHGMNEMDALAKTIELLNL